MMNEINGAPEMNLSIVNRQNYLGYKYADIAINECYEAIKKYEETDVSNFDILELIDFLDEIESKAVITVVFSQMALESFFNDYCAKCLGDDEYYRQFDSLPFASKFLFITIAIFNKKCDKANTPCYSQIVELSKKRNNWVHNKSKEIDMIKESRHSIEDDSETDHRDIYEEIRKRIKRVSLEYLDTIKTSIRTLYNTAKYFDENDRNARAMNHILSFEDGKYYSIFNEEQKRFVLDKLNLSLT